MSIRNICSLWRGLDPAYPTNVAIVLGSAACWVLWGASLGLSVFLAWALTRELDPDHPASAVLAAGLAGLGGYSSGLFVLLLALRLVNRSPGTPARLLDSLLVLGLAWARPQAAWLVAAAFLLDASLERPLKRHFVFAALALVLMAQGSDFSGHLSVQLSWGLILCLSFLSLCIETGPMESVGDANGRRLLGSRVLAAQLLAVLCALLTTWWWQAAGVYCWWSLWSGLFAVVCWRAGSWIWRWLASNSRLSP
ncbi:MAG: hypothetical protein U0931_11380 [Vulcanimicrobiota bacterium]